MKKIEYLMTIVIIVIFLPALSASDFLCGDLNGDGSINILDLTYMIMYLYKGGPPPVTSGAADVNSDQAVNILDLTCLIDLLYKGGQSLNCDFPGDPQSGITDHSGCKNMYKAADSTPFDSSCVEYEYDGSGTLYLTHRNAGLNCCPIIVADISIAGNVINIVEIDSVIDFGCLCLCLFDISYEINYLPPGLYTIRFEEPFLYNQEELEFDVDLTYPVSGSYCVFRDQYPWGVWFINKGGGLK